MLQAAPLFCQCTSVKNPGSTWISLWPGDGKKFSTASFVSWSKAKMMTARIAILPLLVCFKRVLCNGHMSEKQILSRLPFPLPWRSYERVRRWHETHQGVRWTAWLPRPLGVRQPCLGTRPVLVRRGAASSEPGRGHFRHPERLRDFSSAQHGRRLSHVYHPPLVPVVSGVRRLFSHCAGAVWMDESR